MPETKRVNPARVDKNTRVGYVELYKGYVRIVGMNSILLISTRKNVGYVGRIQITFIIRIIIIGVGILLINNKV